MNERVPVNFERIRKVLRLASDIVTKLPTRLDGPLAVFVKIVAILDSMDNATKLKTSFLHEFFAGLKAENATNAQFIDLFFNTPVKDIFTIKRMKVDEYVDIVQAKHEEIGTLHFIEYHWGSTPEHSDEFYFSKGFRFEAVLDHLWQFFHGQVHVEVVQNERRGRPKTLFSQLPLVTDELHGSGAAILQRLMKRQQRAKDEGIHCTYLFLGKAGVGKTTVALQLAGEFGGRCLRLDATGLTTVGVKDLDFLLAQLKPSFLLIDDIDKCASLGSVLPTMLTILADLRSKHPGLLVVLTAATMVGIDPALLRPHRIDKVVEFAPPTREERISFLVALGVTERVSELADATEDLTVAFLHGVAEQLRCGDGFDEVLKDIARYKKLLETAPADGKPLLAVAGAPPIMQKMSA
jgi:ATPase family protein associated with various cellular activities (AAA)